MLLDLFYHFIKFLYIKFLRSGKYGIVDLYLFNSIFNIIRLRAF